MAKVGFQAQNAIAKEERYSVTQLRMTPLIDGPTPYDTLETWEQFLAAMLAEPDTILKSRIVQNAKLMVVRKKPALGWRP